MHTTVTWSLVQLILLLVSIHWYLLVRASDWIVIKTFIFWNKIFISAWRSKAPVAYSVLFVCPGTEESPCFLKNPTRIWKLMLIAPKLTIWVLWSVKLSEPSSVQFVLSWSFYIQCKWENITLWINENPI